MKLRDLFSDDAAIDPQADAVDVKGLAVDSRTVSYRVESDTSVWVSFDVSRPPGLAVTCTVRAMDGRFTVVGSADIVVPPEGDQVVRLDKTVRTTSRAVTGVVQDCVRT